MKLRWKDNMYAHINRMECKLVVPAHPEIWLSRTFIEIQALEADLEKDGVSNHAALVEIAFLAGQYRQMLVLHKDCIEHHLAEIEYINTVLNKHIEKHTPKPEQKRD